MEYMPTNGSVDGVSDIDDLIFASEPYEQSGK